MDGQSEEKKSWKDTSGRYVRLIDMLGR